MLFHGHGLYNLDELWCQKCYFLIRFLSDTEWEFGKNLYPSILAASAELFMNVIIPLSLEQALVTVVQQWSWFLLFPHSSVTPCLHRSVLQGLQTLSLKGHKGQQRYLLKWSFACNSLDSTQYVSTGKYFAVWRTVIDN